MKILITGITGLLGQELAKVLSIKHEVIGLSLKESLPGFEVLNVDITDNEAVYRAISKINPDLVIHTAAKANVDKCEQDNNDAFKVNACGTRNVAVACQRFDTVLAYISTDYVFSGTNNPKDGYTEFDITDPVGVYAKSKAVGEYFVQNLLNKYFIIRTSWLFGASKANFISNIADSVKNNKKTTQVTDMVSSPTDVVDLSQAVSELIDTNLYGIYHITNSGYASRYDIALKIAEILGLPDSLIDKSVLKDLKLIAPRPKFSALNNFTWNLNGFKRLRSWQDAVKDFLS